jgi:nucleotide-binding universal stress UspA family protein
VTTFVRRVVVGVDGTEGSRRALEWVARLAAATGAEVVAAHVLTYNREFAKDLSLDTMRTWRSELRDELQTRWIEPLINAAVTHRTVLVEDDSPATGLLRTCHEEQADLIVVGAKSHRGLGDRILGGVSYRITHAARLPVVVVPPEWEHSAGALGTGEHR